MKPMFTWACLYSSVCAALAQPPVQLRGEIASAGAADISRFTVEARPLAGGAAGPRSLVGPDGSFELRDLQPGVHQLSVKDEHGAVVATEVYSAGGPANHIRIRVANQAPKAGPARAVSVKSLRADPDGKAERELTHALWDARERNWKSARKHFAKALEFDEGYARAAANWAALELQLGNPRQAEEIARKALAIEPADPRLHHGLAASLLAQGIETSETAHELELAGPEAPKLLVASAKLRLKLGEVAEARRVAQLYLRTGDREFEGPVRGFLQTTASK